MLYVAYVLVYVLKCVFCRECWFDVVWQCLFVCVCSCLCVKCVCVVCDLLCDVVWRVFALWCCCCVLLV